MIRDKYPDKISDIRGAGLLIGIQVKDELGKTVFNKLFENKILTSLCSGNTIRIAPPLIITSGDIDLFIKTFEQIIKEI